MTNFRIGTAGWAIPAADRPHFPTDGSALHRYAGVLGAAEINSSFHRPHRRSTYARWADETGGAFRFSVKLPKTITHQQRLVACGDLLDRFVDEVSGLGDKLAVLLVQLPPKLTLDPPVADAFFADLLGRLPVRIACEPRHPSWFAPEAEEMFERLAIARVAADPSPDPRGDRPGGANDLVYFRLHGAPRRYYSAYAPERLAQFAAAMHGCGAREIWCIFDNTAGSHAAGDALALLDLLGSPRARERRPERGV